MESGVGQSPTLQHAVLSALRNLAIPAANKPLLVKCHLVERVLPSMKSDFSVVHFKLLATLRMMVDGQASVVQLLCGNPEFLTKLVSWCTVEDHAGVKGEASRLASWMVKHSQSVEATRALLSHGALPHLVQMAASEHTVMQNEALVALSLIATGCVDEISVDLAREDLVPTLKMLLTDSSTPPEILHNILTLAKQLAAKDDLKQLLVIAEFKSLSKSFHSISDKNIKTAAKALTEVLGKG